MSWGDLSPACNNAEDNVKGNGSERADSECADDRGPVGALLAVD